MRVPECGIHWSGKSWQFPKVNYWATYAFIRQLSKQSRGWLHMHSWQLAELVRPASVLVPAAVRPCCSTLEISKVLSDKLLWKNIVPWNLIQRLRFNRLQDMEPRMVLIFYRKFGIYWDNTNEQFMVEKQGRIRKIRKGVLEFFLQFTTYIGLLYAFIKKNSIFLNLAAKVGVLIP